MNLLRFFFTLSLLITTASLASALEKPNIIIFYVDDLGWQDVGLNDLDAECPYETPNLDKLAAMGMNFTQAYSPAPSCSPSRAGIITGQHPAQLGFTHVDLGKITEGRPKDQFLSPYLDQHLNFDHLTLADAMKDNVLADDGRDLAVNPLLDRGTTESPLLAKLSARKLAGLSPLVDRLRLQAQVFRDLLKRHDICISH